MDDLSNKVALVTGASRGIGRAIALAFARAGMNVAVGFRAEADEAREVIRDIEALQGRAIAVQADVSRSEDVTRLVEQVSSALGPIEVLVNNAGISKPASVDALDEALWDETIDVNLKSVFLVTQAVLPAMRSRRWGRIINLSSTAAQIGGVVGPHYAASKAGILGLTRGYASQLVREGITVNAIAPALIATDMVTANPRAKPEMIPLGRFGQSEEVADVALMLAGNAYITGQTISVNGGIYFS